MENSFAIFKDGFQASEFIENEEKLDKFYLYNDYSIKVNNLIEGEKFTFSKDITLESPGFIEFDF